MMAAQCSRRAGVFALLSSVVCLTAGIAPGSPGPTPVPPAPAIVAPEDKPFPGTIALSIDATDIDRKIIRVHETIPVEPGDRTLLYPKWLPGTHAPEGAIDRFAGLEIRANGARLDWKRDPVDVFAFHLTVPAGATSLDVQFEYLSPVSDHFGDPEITSNMMYLEFIALSLYPAGYFVRQIPVAADVALPAGWRFATALDGASGSGGHVSFKTTSLETLEDSPIVAGRYFSRLDLDPGAAVPVHLDIVADRPSLLDITPAELGAHRALIQQAYKLFGSHHYDHYDFLVSFSESIGGNGLEHHRSSEDSTAATYLSEYDKNAGERDLLPHEFTHSWNGKFRRPEDLWTPNYDTPMRDSLLWVYEGQTEYWGKVLAARSGLWTRDQALDELALLAAIYDNVPGRQWRALQDTTNDEIINPRRPMSWRSWQRFEDYYDEGALVWLDADTLIRDLSHGSRSLDDFARAFFGIDDGSFVTVTYGFDDVVKALNAVQPYDWAKFLRSRLDSTGQPAPLDGVKRGGYSLVYTDVASEYFKSVEEAAKVSDLRFSLGVVVDKEGAIKSVLWDSPAFKAGLTAGAHIVAVDGVPYDGDVLKDAIKTAKGGTGPIELIIRTPDLYRTIRIDYHDGLRYPHLQREQGRPALLDSILAARK
jgi:predicted metalloprotease with PDZ domain